MKTGTRVMVPDYVVTDGQATHGTILDSDDETVIIEFDDGRWQVVSTNVVTTETD